MQPLDNDYREFKQKRAKTKAGGFPVSDAAIKLMEDTFNPENLKDGLGQDLLDFFKHPQNSSVGPVPMPNDFMLKNKKKGAFFRLTDEDFLYMMRLNLILMNAVAPVLAAAPPSEQLEKAKDGFQAGALLYEHLHNFRRKNFYKYVADVSLLTKLKIGCVLIFCL